MGEASRAGSEALERLRRPDYEAATRRVQERILLYGHLTWYFWLNLLFALINSLLTPAVWWWVPVALFWGVGVLVHLVAVFFVGDLNGPFRRRALRSELERLAVRR